MSEPTRPDRGPEPEIIPPGREIPRSGRRESRVFISFDTRSGQVHGGLGSVIALILGIVIVSIAVAAILIILLGALLVWVPVVTFLLAGLLILAILRSKFRSLRGRMRGNVPADSSRAPPEP
jgi:hypothetical protein